MISPLLLAYGGAALPEPDVIRRTADEVIRRPEFQLTPVRDFSPIWEWLWRLIEPILGFFGRLWDISPALAVVFVVVLVIVLVALVAHIMYAFARAISGGKGLAGIGPLGRRRTDPSQLESDADEAARRGDFIQAVRLLFRAALVRLEHRQNREPRPGITNREYLRRYRDSAVFEALRQFVDVIDAKWYGYGTCDAADYDRCRQAHALIRGAAGAGA